MNLLITGGLGHIGAFILKNLDKIKKIKKIYVLDANFNNNFNSIFLNNLNRKIHLNVVDIINFDFSKIKKIDYILHLASHTNAENSLNNKSFYIKNNFEIFKKICLVAKKNNSKLIHISSTSIYGKSNQIVYEDDYENLKPQSPYALIKFKEEKFLKTQNINYVTFRFGTISGVSEGIRFHTAVNKFCLNASLGYEIPIWRTALHQLRPYLSLRDAFYCIKYFIDNNLFDNQVYNVVTQNLTVNHIVSYIRFFKKKKLKVKFVNSRIMNQLSYEVSRKKIEKKGFKFKGSIKKDVKDTLKLLKMIN